MFQIPRRMAAISNLNIRTEKHGSENVKAVDITTTFTGDASILDLLVPSPKDKDNLTSEFFFSEDGHLRVPTMNPVKLNRNPEGLMFSIFDRKEPMVFREGSAKGFEIEFQEGGTVKIKCTLQGIPDAGYTERLKNALSSTVEVLIESEQDDLFAQPAPDGDEKDDGQADLIDQATTGRRPRGVGKAEGLRQSEVRVKAEESEQEAADRERSRIMGAGKDKPAKAKKKAKRGK